ncbi:MAG TPA: acyltransferase [Blattabacteriaceae bacterium]|nr:acyltransferase [Blattabacteriaceae bacterium]
MKLLDSSSAREPGLDLMRAVAILWVMLWHMHFALRPGIWSGPGRYGWMGVDLFFVLSGYLIGSQLLRPYTRGGRPSIGGFYMRRAFRVLPAYLTVLLFYFAIPGFREAPGLSPAWQFLTFTENFRIDYLHDQAFSHVWSLCVEEHFYLVLPVLILLLMRRPNFGKALVMVLGILCFGIGIRAYIYLHQIAIFPRDDDAFALAYVERIYYPTHTRLDGLLVGVTLAAIKTFRPAWWQRAMSHGYLLLVGGLALCAGAVWLFNDRLSFSASVVGFPLLAVGLGLLIASSIAPSSPLSRVRGFGLIAALAYSAYLTHKEIIHFLRSHSPRLVEGRGWLALVAYFGFSFLAAFVLYMAVERPFLGLRERISSHAAKAAQVAATS